MLQIIRLGGCIHIYDTAQTKFVKCNLTNLRMAAGVNHPQATRNSILQEIEWALNPENPNRLPNNQGVLPFKMK